MIKPTILIYFLHLNQKCHENLSYSYDIVMNESHLSFYTYKYDCFLLKLMVNVKTYSIRNQ